MKAWLSLATFHYFIKNKYIQVRGKSIDINISLTFVFITNGFIYAWILHRMFSLIRRHVYWFLLQSMKANNCQPECRKRILDQSFMAIWSGISLGTETFGFSVRLSTQVVISEIEL
jgi:hypothetical protein